MLNIKTPQVVERYRTSDGQEFDSEEDARTQEVFLALLPVVAVMMRQPQIINPSTVAAQVNGDRGKQDSALVRNVIRKLAEKFDFVPRDPSVPSVDSPMKF